MTAIAQRPIIEPADLADNLFHLEVSAFGDENVPAVRDAHVLYQELVVSMRQDAEQAGVNLTTVQLMILQRAAKLFVQGQLEEMKGMSPNALKDYNVFLTNFLFKYNEMVEAAALAAKSDLVDRIQMAMLETIEEMPNDKQRNQLKNAMVENFRNRGL